MSELGKINLKYLKGPHLEKAAKQIRDLRLSAEEFESWWNWSEIALQWIDAATKEIVRLRKMIGEENEST